MPRLRFWLTSLLAALLVALTTATIFPYGALGIESGSDRHQTWLLTVWTSGVMAICFGATGLLAGVVPLGFRDVNAAGSLQAAREERLKAQRDNDSNFFNFAGWTVTTGAILVIVYFVAWTLSSTQQ